MVKLKLTNKYATTKGIAKKIPPKRGKRVQKKQVDEDEDSEDFVPAPRRKTKKSILEKAASSFSATASGNAYEPEPAVDHDGLELDANGGIEFRTGDTPIGLFSPKEGESWDVPYTPVQIFKTIEEPTINDPSPERDLETPEARPLDRMFTPDAPEPNMSKMSKKIITRFVSDYGENVPKSAEEGTYTGPSITAVVVKTFVPCYIVQMPKEVRARIYSHVLFPNGKSKAPRPYFSNGADWRMKSPALLQTCLQIRKETSGPYYSSIIAAGASVAKLVPWLRTLSPGARSAIGKVMVPFDAGNHVDKTKEQQIRLCLKEFRKAGIEIKRARFNLVVQPYDVERSLGGNLTDDE